MVLTGCLRPPELYDAVQWDVIFLLAGVIPLGTALQETGGAGLLAELFVMGAGDPRRRGRPRRRSRAVVPRHGAADERHLEQRERRAHDSGRHRRRPATRRQRLRVRPRRHLRGVDGVHDPRRLPDEPVRLRPRRLHVLGLSGSVRRYRPYSPSRRRLASRISGASLPLDLDGAERNPLLRDGERRMCGTVG